MTVTHTPGAVSRFRRTPWRFQRTVEVDRRSVAVIAAALTDAGTDTKEVTIIIDRLITTSPLAELLSPSVADSLTHNSPSRSRATSSVRRGCVGCHD
jgi:hypothetical protein